MLDAICVFDEAAPITYTVFKFQKLADDEIERLRQSLICPVCNGKAYFRKASKDGRAACFGSRYHQADCSEFKPSKSKVGEEQAVAEINQVLIDSDALMIDFSVKKPLLKLTQEPSISPQTLMNDKLQVSDNVPPISTDLLSSVKRSMADTQELPDGAMSRVSQQGLEKLLHSLLRGSELAESELWVYTDEKYRWRAKNLFVNFADAEPTEKGAPRMYWGTLSHSDKSMNWLNPADCTDVGIPIDEFKQSLLSQFDIQERRDLEGAGVILFGKCFWNKEKTRKIIQLWGKDISRIAISKLED